MLVVLALDPRHVGLRFGLFLTVRMVDAFDTDPHGLAVQLAAYHNDVDFSWLSGDGIWELDRLPNLLTVFHQLDHHGDEPLERLVSFGHVTSVTGALDKSGYDTPMEMQPDVI